MDGKLILNSQEQEEPNDSEVEPNEEFPQKPTAKAGKEVSNEMVTSTDPPVHNTSADEEAVNKVAEKIDTLRMGPRQVRTNLDGSDVKCLKILSSQEHEMDEPMSTPNAGLLPDPDPEIVPGKIVNIQPTAPLQSGITEQKS